MKCREKFTLTPTAGTGDKPISENQLKIFRPLNKAALRLPKNKLKFVGEFKASASIPMTSVRKHCEGVWTQLIPSQYVRGAGVSLPAL